MKDSVKKFFLLGLGIAAAGAAAGYAMKNKDKVEKAVNELVEKGKILEDDARILAAEFMYEVKKLEKKAAGKKEEYLEINNVVKKKK
jgi:polyhydroxyalkanoate synthesis regulator phasin